MCENISKGSWGQDLLPKSDCINAMVVGLPEWETQEAKAVEESGAHHPDTPPIAERFNAAAG